RTATRKSDAYWKKSAMRHAANWGSSGTFRLLVVHDPHFACHAPHLSASQEHLCTKYPCTGDSSRSLTAIWWFTTDRIHAGERTGIVGRASGRCLPVEKAAGFAAEQAGCRSPRRAWRSEVSLGPHAQLPRGCSSGGLRVCAGAHSPAADRLFLASAAFPDCAADTRSTSRACR